MDWSKAKSIFIMVFLALNLFLLGYRYINDGRIGYSREISANTIEILKTRKVTLNCKIPVLSGSVPRLSFTGGKLGTVKVAEALLGKMPISGDNMLPGTEVSNETGKVIFNEDGTFIYNGTKQLQVEKTDDIKETDKKIREVLKDMGIAASSFVLDEYSQNEDGNIHFTYIEKYKNFLVYENCISATVDKGRITYLEGKYRFKKVSGFSPENIAEIIPVYKILLKEFNTGKQEVIEKIDIGYKGLADYEEELKESSESPVWRIIMSDGVTRYFEALSGKELN